MKSEDIISMIIMIVFLVSLLIVSLICVGAEVLFVIKLFEKGVL